LPRLIRGNAVGGSAVRLRQKTAECRDAASGDLTRRLELREFLFAGAWPGAAYLRGAEIVSEGGRNCSRRGAPKRLGGDHRSAQTDRDRSAPGGVGSS